MNWTNSSAWQLAREQNWGYPAVGEQMPILSFAVVGGVAVAVTADEIPHPEFFRNPGFLA